MTSSHSWIIFVLNPVLIDFLQFHVGIHKWRRKFDLYVYCLNLWVNLISLKSDLDGFFWRFFLPHRNPSVATSFFPQNQHIDEKWNRRLEPFSIEFQLDSAFEFLSLFFFKTGFLADQPSFYCRGLLPGSRCRPQRPRPIIEASGKRRFFRRGSQLEPRECHDEEWMKNQVEVGRITSATRTERQSRTPKRREKERKTTPNTEANQICCVPTTAGLSFSFST